jgi:hypothetical protein
MKKNGASHALVSPGATGWRIRINGGTDSTVPTLGEALDAIPADAHIELSLPCQSVLLERHTLPATDRAELADMLQLQLEKTLPFPVEEVTHGYELLGQADNESTILSIAAHHTQLDQICAPLRDKGRLPERITLEAQRVASSCPVNETVLALWPEQDQLAVAIVTGGKLAWAQPLSSRDAETVLSELPGLLISAELEGVPVNFAEVLLSRQCADLEPGLAEQLQKPIRPLAEDDQNEAGLDLLPVSWQHEARSRERGEKLKQNLLLAAVIYLVLLAGGFISLAWYKKQVQNVQAEVAREAPKYAVINQEKARWEVFAPAVENSRYAVEVMFQLWKSWKEVPDLQFTSFRFTPTEWVLKGEGTRDLHFQFFTKGVKQNHDLTDFYDVDSPYQPLKDDRISFTVTGKPKNLNPPTKSR